ncbi:DUF389 domain-containing protein [Aureivirga sp. CE67]|uniref:DUF389 domain-containing protein n=1 Tax=Aureivirga sp. CE67 TaxID=1788983 RepID=UPI0018CA1DFE|nr:DUF389 domain-containing protein [Aureivirga sp. CE67]
MEDNQNIDDPNQNPDNGNSGENNKQNNKAENEKPKDTTNSESQTNNDENTTEKEKVSASDVKNDFKGLWASVKQFLIELLDIREGTNRERTIEDIKGNISMKGHTAWILIMSILIASIGLNVSSTAVVIGAMLVSPLMGPIVGVGLSLAINDIDTLKRSMTNLGVMIGLSLVTSFLLFSFPIFQEETPEILARTKPDVRDVFIAIAGGLALIIALTRHKELTNTIAGIAIATALMPPLCTAGYGLATWNFAYFGGAMFLFMINTIFIALATFVTIKFLNFPVVRYFNSSKRKMIAQTASIVAIVVFSFSIYLFYELLVENKFKQSAMAFIKELKSDGINILGEDEKSIDYTNKEINLAILGKIITEEEQERWEKALENRGLHGVKLNFRQGEDNSDIRKQVENLTDLYKQNQKIISTRDEEIRAKENKIKELRKELKVYRAQEFPFSQISKEAKINYEGLDEISYSKVIQSNFQHVDTFPVISIKWHKNVTNLETKEIKLRDWLKTRIDNKKLKVVTIE